jgi:hypothetical protein
MRGGNAVTTPGGATLMTVTHSAPDPPALARFSARLLGWGIVTKAPRRIMCIAAPGLASESRQRITP